jgi:hypothetical protein
MLATNGEFEAIARRLDQTIARLDAAMSNGVDVPSAAEWCDYLVRRRRAIDLLLINRRLEASRPVVEFARWADGNGALYAAAESGGFGLVGDQGLGDAEATS